MVLVFSFVFVDSGMTDMQMMTMILMVVSLMYLFGILIVAGALTSIMQVHLGKNWEALY